MQWQVNSSSGLSSMVGAKYREGGNGQVTKLRCQKNNLERQPIPSVTRLGTTLVGCGEYSVRGKIYVQNSTQ